MKLGYKPISKGICHLHDGAGTCPMIHHEHTPVLLYCGSVDVILKTDSGIPCLYVVIG